MKKKISFISILVMVIFSLTIICCQTSPPPEEPVEEEKPEAPIPEPEKPKLPAIPPMLSIETDMHSAPINRIAMDKDSSILVSASDDKTVRVWDVETLELVSTIRPFSQTGNEGRLYAVAITPNGNTIACAGWTMAETDTYNIYIINRQDGTLVHRIGNIPNVINHLEFSANGQFLAAALGGNNGIRLFNADTYKEIATDQAYDNSSYWLDFDPRDRLITSSYDGYIRLYDIANSDINPENSSEPINLDPIFKVKTTDGKHPFAVSFSPDGSLVAVGFTDSTAISVYAGENLKLMHSPIKEGSNYGAYGTVSWSPDGQHLFAGGQNATDGLLPVIRWTDMGNGTRDDWLGTRDTIMQVMGLTGGGAVYVSADPAIGILSSTGENIYRRTAEIPTFRGSRSALMLSQDGKVVQFGYQYGGADKKQFSVNELTLTDPMPEPVPDTMAADVVPDETAQPVKVFAPPDIQSLQVDGWKNGLTPKFNGTALKLKTSERSRSFAVAPGQVRFYSGHPMAAPS